MRGAISTLVLCTLLSAGPARAGDPGVRRPSHRLEISGAVLFGLSYLVPLVLSVRYEQPILALPVPGPVIDLYRCGNCTGSPIESGIIATLGSV